MIWRIFYLSVCTLILAGIVHVSIILLVPEVGTKDAYALLSRQTEPFRFQAFDPLKGEGVVSDVDPFFAYGVCRFEIGETGMHIKGPPADSIWSATLVNEDGGVVYSLNSRTAIEGRLDLLLVDPVMVLRLREVQPAEIESSIIVESDIRAGFIILRVFRPDESWEPLARRFLDAIECRPYVPGVPAEEPSGPPSS